MPAKSSVFYATLAVLVPGDLGLPLFIHAVIHKKLGKAPPELIPFSVSQPSHHEGHRPR